jgi:hypothetical protein
MGIYSFVQLSGHVPFPYKRHHGFFALIAVNESLMGARVILVGDHE